MSQFRDKIDFRSHFDRYSQLVFVGKQYINKSLTMTLVWTIIATFLYVEIGIVLLFVVPIASPLRWQRLFKSQFLAMIGRQAHIYFVLLLGILVLFLLEAIREMRKYSNYGECAEHYVSLAHQTQLSPPPRRQPRRDPPPSGAAAQHAPLPRPTQLLHFWLLHFPHSGHPAPGDSDLCPGAAAGPVGGLDAPGPERHQRRPVAPLSKGGRRQEREIEG